MNIQLSSKEFYYYAGTTIRGLLAVAASLMLGSLAWMVGTSHLEQAGAADVYWIFYLHLSAFIVAVACYFLMSASALGVLFKKDSIMAPVLAAAAAPTGFIMTFFALGTGALFGRTVWGSLWVWDMRLTGLVILLLFFGAFLTFVSLRSANARRQSDVRASVAALLGLFLIPGLYIFFDMFSPLRADLYAALRGSGKFEPLILMVVFTLSLVLYATAMILSRGRTVLMERDHRSVWMQEDALEGVL